MGSIDKTLYDRLGGKPTFETVHKTFYDKVYAHSWLGKYFTNSPQEVIESQQTDFMIQLMGGPKCYGGKIPKSAHQNMMISEELFELRAQMLSDSIREAGIADDLRIEWLNADAALKKSIVKTSVTECKKAYPSQEILDFKN